MRSQSIIIIAGVAFLAVVGAVAPASRAQEPFSGFPRRFPLAAEVQAGERVTIGAVEALPQAHEASPPELKGVSSAGAIVVDRERGRTLGAKDADKVLPIASITKLAFALVFLQARVPWDTEVTIESVDLAPGRQHFSVGDRLPARDLFFASLVGSSNTGVRALVRSTGLSQEEFVSRMNEEARALGLFNTRFADPTGLDPDNSSTARDVSILFARAFRDPVIASALSFGSFPVSVGGRTRLIASTDALLSRNLPQGLTVLGGKTGSLPEDGYSFVGGFSLPDGRRIDVVVLNSPSHGDRFRDAATLAAWAAGQLEREQQDQ